jgi:aspartate/methionine/tyrosine aminotransferase
MSPRNSEPRSAPRSPPVVRSSTPGTTATRVPPYAGIICFPRFEGVEDTVSLARRALEEHGVMTSPGEFFGMPGHLRIGVGHPDVEHVREGLRLLGDTLDGN